MDSQQPMQQQQPAKSYESQLSSGLYGGTVEKTFVDKVLAKEEVNEIKQLMQKSTLTREDLLKLLYLLAGNEIKLLNFGEFDRYLLGKFFAWVRDFVSCAELLFDYKDRVERKEVKISKLARAALKNSETMLLHDIKFVIDIYCYLGRSTLSLGAVSFDTLTSQRFEYAYSNALPVATVPDNKGFQIKLGGKK